MELKKNGKPKLKPGPRKKETKLVRNPIPKSSRDTRKELTAKPNNDACREELLMLILSGSYNAKTLFEQCQKYQAGINWVRQRADEAFSLVRILQDADRDPAEAKDKLKADIDQKLDFLYEASLNQSRPDLRTALNVITSKAKLHGIYDPEKIELINNPTAKITQAEISYIRETGKLPESIVLDWQKQLIEGSPDDKENPNG